MFKILLLAGTMFVAAPALAQTTGSADATATTGDGAPGQTAPAPDASMTPPADPTAAPAPTTGSTTSSTDSATNRTPRAPKTRRSPTSTSPTTQGAVAGPVGGTPTTGMAEPDATAEPRS